MMFKFRFIAVSLLSTAAILFFFGIRAIREECAGTKHIFFKQYPHLYTYETSDFQQYLNIWGIDSGGLEISRDEEGKHLYFRGAVPGSKNYYRSPLVYVLPVAGPPSSFLMKHLYDCVLPLYAEKKCLAWLDNKRGVVVFSDGSTSARSIPPSSFYDYTFDRGAPYYVLASSTPLITHIASAYHPGKVLLVLNNIHADELLYLNKTLYVFGYKAYGRGVAYNTIAYVIAKEDRHHNPRIQREGMIFVPVNRDCPSEIVDVDSQTGQILLRSDHDMPLAIFDSWYAYDSRRDTIERLGFAFIHSWGFFLKKDVLSEN